jgi:ribosomal protein L40E
MSASEIFSLLLMAGAITGTIGALLGGTKGNAMAGFFAGAFLGPIGWLIALLLPANEAAIAEQAVLEGRQKQCPACLSMIPTAAIKCRHCATEQPEPKLNDSNENASGQRVSQDFSDIDESILWFAAVLVVVGIFFVFLVL